MTDTTTLGFGAVHDAADSIQAISASLQALMLRGDLKRHAAAPSSSSMRDCHASALCDVPLGKVLGEGDFGRVHEVDNDDVLRYVVKETRDKVEGAYAKPPTPSPLLMSAPAHCDSGTNVTDLDSALIQSACWDASSARFECRDPILVEPLLNHLASKLYSDGVTPHCLVQRRAAVCIDGHVRMELERVTSPGGNTLADLPYILEMLEPGVWLRGDVARQQSGDAARSPLPASVSNAQTGSLASIMPPPPPVRDLPLLFTPSNRVRLAECVGGLFISAVHTLAVMQEFYGLQTLDTKPQNILLKVVGSGAAGIAGDPTTLFRGKPINTRTVRAIRYDFPSMDASGATVLLSLYVPFNGIVAKISDMGIGSAYRVATPDARITQLIRRADSSGYVAEMSDSAWLHWTSRKYSDAVASLLAVEIKDKLGVGVDEAAEMAERALRNEYAGDAREFDRIMLERSMRGLEPSDEFVKWYDPQFLHHTLVEEFVRWNAAHPVRGFVSATSTGTIMDALTSVLGIKTSAFGRPDPYQHWKCGPLDVLGLLYRIGEGTEARVPEAMRQEYMRMMAPFMDYAGAQDDPKEDRVLVVELRRSRTLTRGSAAPASWKNF